MKISECTQIMSKANMAFNGYLKRNRMSLEGLTRHYDLVMSSPEGEHTINAVLIGTYDNSQHFFQFPFHPDNPAVQDEDRALYLSLQQFALRARIPELSETNISFDATMVAPAQAARGMSPPSIYRHFESGEVVSCLTLQELISIAAIFYKATAFIAVENGDYSVYLAVLDNFEQQ
jgi:hypothetical protein